MLHYPITCYKIQILIGRLTTKFNFKALSWIFFFKKKKQIKCSRLGKKWDWEKVKSFQFLSFIFNLTLNYHLVQLLMWGSGLNLPRGS